MQTDVANNASATITVTWNRVVTMQAAPVIDTPTSSETYASNTVFSNIEGDCLLDHAVTLTGADSGGVSCDAGLRFSFTIAAPGTDGTYQYFVTQTDPVSGATSPAAKLSWTYDTIAPVPVVLQNPTVSPEVTANNPTLIISGTCETGNTVGLNETTVGGEGLLGSQTCMAGGFSFPVSKAPNASYNLSVTQQDAAGNVSEAVLQDWVSTDTIPVQPTITSITRTDSPGSLTMPIYTDNSAEVVISGTCTYDGYASKSVPTHSATSSIDHWR